MVDYTKTTNFGAKDSLASGNANKVVQGSEFDTEFDAIVTAVASKYDSDDLANQATAEAGTSNTTLMTPLRTQQWGEEWAGENAGIVGDLQALADPNADRVFGWDDSAGAAIGFSLGSGLTFSGTTIQTTISPLTAIGTVDAANDVLLIQDATDGSVRKISVADLVITGGGGVPDSRSLTAGDGLSGGGDLSADRTFNVDLLGIEDLTDPGGDRIMFWDDSAGNVTWLQLDGNGKLVISGTTLSVSDANIVHDSLSGFVANEHVDHSSVSITAGNGLTGGGTIAASRTINIGAGNGISVATDSVAVNPTNGLSVSGSGVQISTTLSAAPAPVNMAPTDQILYNDGGTWELLELQNAGIPTFSSSAAQTFALGDANTCQVLTGSTDRDWTIPPNSSVAFPVGTVIIMCSRDTAVLGVDPGSGVTLTSKNASGTSTQDIAAGGTGVIIKVATDEWMLSGDLA
jgi:hypothetical protein